MARDFGKELARLGQEVKNIKQGQRYAHGGSIEDAALEVKDSTGAVRAVIGMQPDGTVGLVAHDGPPPGAPTAPTVTPSIGGLRIVWDGALADGSPLPADFDHVAVHVSAEPGAEPSAGTFAGTITASGEGGMLPVTPLPYQPHYVRLVAVNTSGIGGAPSAETAATPQQVEGPDLKAGSVTAPVIQAGAVTADKLEAVLQLVTRLVAGDPAGARVELNENGLRVYNSAGELVIRFDAADGSAVFTGDITGSNISGSTVTGSTVTGGLIRTAASGERITLNESGQNKVIVYNASGTAIGELSTRGLLVQGTNGANLWLDPNNTFPSLRLTNAARTNAAIVNVSGTNAVLGMNSGTYSASGATWKWRTIFGMESGVDFWASERVRDDNNLIHAGGRIYLTPTTATFGYRNASDTSQDAYLHASQGLVQLNGNTNVVGSLTANGRPVPVPGAWTNLTAGAWSTTPANTAYQSIRVATDGTRAYLDGAASTLTAFSTGSQNAFTIPAGLRPLKDHYFGLVRATGGDPRFLGCRIQSNGVVVVYASTAVATGDTFDFSNISWPLD